ncbi:aldehyde dehydrogenase (NADP(+)) [Undibacterium squillarum]|uniref:aldehyde dehydrogenase (NADP(+)) n=1 Tax=Undibacterium squillarum TaxID=1131567 RepID=UPI0035AF165D
MELQGQMLIGHQQVMGKSGGTHAINPATGEKMEPFYGFATPDETDRACVLAYQAFDTYRQTSLTERAAFLEAIADQIMAIGPALIARAHLETGLPVARLEGERGRTVNQLRLFAQVVRDGHWLNATLDSALPERTPPRPDLRMQKIPLGPVAVFGASNFPLAFSVAGGDTASALAAGCPVVVKAHNAHLGTSELVGRAIQKAVVACNMPEGTFSMVIGAGAEVGQQLVAHPVIQAVGFTGSRNGGLALVNTANARKVPIPVYAEMSAINPVYLLKNSLSQQAVQLAQQFIDSLTLGAGQFCTNPGLVLLEKGTAADQFIEAAKTAVAAKAAATMLTPGIYSAYASGCDKLQQQPQVSVLGKGQAGTTPNTACAMISSCDADTFISNHALQDEVFGPSSLIILCDDMAQMLEVTAHLEGQLTATIHALPADYEEARVLLHKLETKAGRVLFNGFPTGVEVCHAMVHGGPFPSTSDSRSTSVGATAIDRFLRPVCYQAVPAELLPEGLQDHNPWQLARTIDGKLKL